MSFLENLGATIGGGAKTALDKGKELKDVAAIKAQIASIQANLGKLYKELGKAYYDENKEAAAYSDKMAPIKDALDKISELESKLMDAQGNVKCPVGGASVEAGAQFCPKCGAAMSSSDSEIPIE